MLRRNEGYFLAEMLLSLTAWLLVTGFLLPMVMVVSKQAELLRLQNTALHLLYDELELLVDEGDSIKDKSLLLNGTTYEIRWSEEMSQKKVCVEYKDVDANVHKTCQSPEQ
ncbi:hypothetical protein [Neobacillus sp. LXY-4]|uniref:hypothetical protein n=1 Tax=Neobacillus sp. LXY-4 TaxID=3379826 RepID=UPI003EE0BABC